MLQGRNSVKFTERRCFPHAEADSRRITLLRTIGLCPFPPVGSSSTHCSTASGRYRTRGPTLTYCGPRPRSLHFLRQARLTCSLSETCVSFKSESITYSLPSLGIKPIWRDSRAGQYLGQISVILFLYHSEPLRFEIPRRPAIAASKAVRLAVIRIWL